MPHKFTYLLLVTLLLGACSERQRETPIHFSAPTPAPNPHLQAFTRDYIQQFDALFNYTKTPGAALVFVKDTLVLHIDGYGIKQVNTNDSIDIHTAFRVGSLSKGFASILAGVQVDKKLINWTDKVIQHLPNFQLKDAAQTQRVNLIHLLSQTSGLPYHAFTNLIESGMELSQINQSFKEVDLIGKEGTVYAYQNASYSLIGTIMENINHQSLSVLFEEELFSPLGMEDASTTLSALEKSENVALPHIRGRHNWRTRRLSAKYYNAIPAGGVNASISDMGHWLQLLLGNRPEIISKASLQQVFKPRINTRNKARYFHKWPMVDDSFYALGWRVLTNPKDTFLYHGGYVNGYRGETLVYPAEKLGICVLTNAPSELPNKAIPLFIQTYNKYRDSIKIEGHKRVENKIQKDRK